MTDKQRIGVVGAGTMGAGIALSALYAGYLVVLQDKFPAVLDRADTYIKKFLEKKDLSNNIKNLTLSAELSALKGADIVIEAAPETLEIKQQLFSDLEDICSPKTILASNTSTLSITKIAAGMKFPERLAGMHFFNPAPVLPLVEIVQGSQSSLETLDILELFAKNLGKQAVRTTDTPGFIVNRVARPYYGEALRILGEGAATFDQIDHILEGAAGFRMGPFRLMDLIGIDINAGAMQSMFEQTFSEPRYRPHPIQMRKLAEGALGRKTGRGFYDYTDDEIKKEKVPSKAGTGEGIIWLSKGTWAPALVSIIKDAGYEISEPKKGDEPVAAIVQAGRNERAFEEMQKLAEFLPAKTPFLIQSVDIAFSEIAQQGFSNQIVGFDGLFLAGNQFTLQGHPSMSKNILSKVNALIQNFGYQSNWLQESPALVVPRIIAQLVNEAAFAVQQGVADGKTIDLAMRLGVNYPRGPIEWGAEIGFSKILAIIDHLFAEFHEERYRACSLLRQWARSTKIKR